MSTAILAVLGARGAQAQMCQAPFGPNGTWNLYELEPVAVQWVFANEDAACREQEGGTGHLVDILSAGENLWIHRTYGVQGQGIDNLWIGLTDREGVAPPANNGGLPAPQESRELPDQFTHGWAWTSGKEFVFVNWGSGEPNNWGGAAAGTALSGIEDVAHIRNNGLWNDHSGGFLADDPIEPVL